MLRYKKISAILVTALMFTSIISIPAYAAETSIDTVITNENEEVNVPSKRLRKQICKTLKVDENHVITKSDLKSITDFSVPEYEDNLEGLQFCTNLKKIYISDYRGSNISQLSGLKSLEALTIYAPVYSNASIDLSPISNLTNLTSLSTGYLSSDFSFLKNLKKLTKLCLDYVTNPNLSYLYSMPELTYLNLYHNDISDITPVSSLKNLKTFNFNNNNVSDISPLSNLKSLTRLSFEHNSSISDLSPIKDLVNLDYLNISDVKSKDLSQLKNMKKLKTLEASFNEIDDVSSLSSLTELNDLDLSFNKITDISPLNSLTKLNKLQLSNNSISDISTIANLKMHSYRNTLIDNQNISIRAKSENGKLSLKNPIINFKGEGCTYLSLISNNGSYDVETNTINWQNVKAGDKLTFEFMIGDLYKNEEVKYNKINVPNITLGPTFNFGPFGNSNERVVEDAPAPFTGKVEVVVD